MNQRMNDYLRCPLCKDVLKEPVSIPCGHSFCKTCIQSYWQESTHESHCSCPQCRKRFKTRPALNLNLALNHMLKEAGFSPALPAQSYAGPEDVACDICTGKRMRSVKWCLTCSVAYCETHVRQHYTVEALQRHTLIEVTEELETRTCQLHHRALEAFCRTDQVFICLVCVMEEHKDHDTLLAKREAQDAKANSSDLLKVQFSSLSESGIKDQVQQNDVELKDKARRAEAELAYLTKRFCRGFGASSDFTSEFVEVAALGRQLDLGMLYDCRSESFSSDIILWEKSLISSMKLSVPRPQTDVRILEDDTLQDRLTALDLSTSLRSSVVSGLVKCAGASEFINHPIRSWLQDKITLHYRTSTRLDMLSHELLHSRFPLSVTGSTTATHVVVAVLYGSQAFLVLDGEKDRSAENTNLKGVIKKMIASSSQTGVLFWLSKELKIAPAAFVDGLVLQSPINSTLQNAGAVPLKVWLYPLKNLDPTSACVAKDISEDQLCKAEKVLGHLGLQISFCHHMMKIFYRHDVFTLFPAVKDTLSEFSSLLQQYQSNFQTRLAFCIKSTRERGEDGLQELLKMNVQSPFSLDKTYQWLQNKSTEMRALIQCRSANVTIVKGQNDLQRLVQDSQADRVLCFIFTSLEGKDPFLSALTQHIKSINMPITTGKQQTFVVSETSRKLLSDLKTFLLNKEADENKQKTMFIAASVPDPCFPGSAVHLYQSRNLVRQNNKLEVNVEAAKLIAVQQTWVKVKLQTAEHYRVEYRAVKEDGSPLHMKWRVISCTEENCVVSGLAPRTRYQLRYSLMDSNRSMSDYSTITEFRTSIATPGPPTVLELSKESLHIAWHKPESDEDSPVPYYIVEYLEAGLEGWQSIQTDDPVCECTITLPYSTCYRARVSAVYEHRDISTPSEETEIPVHVWNINLSERKASLLAELLKLQPVMKPVEITGWTDEEGEMQSLLQCLLYVSHLSLSSDVVVRMAHAVETIKAHGPVKLKELSVVQRSTQQPDEAPSMIQSSLASLLRLWEIDCLNLTEYKMEARSHTALINQCSLLIIRFSEETLQKLVVVIYESQDEELTRCFLQKVCGDLTSCCMTWEAIHFFLQHQTVTVDFKRSPIKQENIRDLLPLLDRLRVKRLNSSFVLAVMKEICETGSAHCVSGLLCLVENCINLENRQLNSVDCSALRFTLQHCEGISLNLLWTSIPEGELESIVPLLRHVSHLRVDRLLLLRLLHCCSAPELQQEAAVLLSALHHKLDFSCDDALDLTADTTTYTLSVEDCSVICMAVQGSHEHICLILHDCEIEEDGAKQLFPILHAVTLYCSEALMLRFPPSAPSEAELKPEAQEDDMDLGPGPVDHWDWFWNILKDCQ